MNLHTIKSIARKRVDGKFRFLATFDADDLLAVQVELSAAELRTYASLQTAVLEKTGRLFRDDSFEYGRGLGTRNYAETLEDLMAAATDAPEQIAEDVGA